MDLLLSHNLCDGSFWNVFYTKCPVARTHCRARPSCRIQTPIVYNVGNIPLIYLNGLQEYANIENR